MISKLIKSHIIITIIVSITIVIIPIIILNKDNIVKKENKILANGTYSCDIEIDGYKLSSDKGKDIFIERIKKIFPELIKDYDKNSFDETELNMIKERVTATKDNNYIYLNINSSTPSSFKYKISNGKTTIDFDDKLTDKEKDFISKMKVSYNSKGITFEKFLNMIYIYPNYRVYNSDKYDDVINSAFDVSLGDLVCRKKIKEINKDNTYSEYDKIIEKYKEVLITPKDKKKELGVTIDDYYEGDKYYYYLYDINKDGIKELIVAEDYSGPSLLEIYYLDDNKNVHAIEYTKYGSLNTIYENGQIKLDCGGGAHGTTNKYLGNTKDINKKVSSWDSYELIIYYDIIYGGSEEIFKYDNNKKISITYDEYNKIINSFGKKIDYTKWKWETIETDYSKQFIGKYIGTGSDYAKESYIELLDNYKVRLRINNCSGYSTYTGTYSIGKLEYTDDLVVYIDSFKIQDGIELDMPKKGMAFQIDGNKLYTMIGYLDTNNFDCGVKDTLVKKS